MAPSCSTVTSPGSGAAAVDTSTPAPPRSRRRCGGRLRRLARLGREVGDDGLRSRSGGSTCSPSDGVRGTTRTSLGWALRSNRTTSRRVWEAAGMDETTQQPPAPTPDHVREPGRDPRPGGRSTSSASGSAATRPPTAAWRAAGRVGRRPRLHPGRAAARRPRRLRAVDLDHVTGKRSPFASFAARAEGHKVRDEQGNHLVDLRVTFDVTFPEGPEARPGARGRATHPADGAGAPVHGGAHGHPGRAGHLRRGRPGPLSPRRPGWGRGPVSRR